MLRKLELWLSENHTRMAEWMPYVLITALGFAFFNPAVRFPPVDFDDLLLLASVKHTSNPLVYLVGDWGFGNNAYRPLHSLSLWLGYQLFGVSSGPNQLINILLHVSVILLLFGLLRRLSVGWVSAFFISALSLFSMYTTSPATWVSDRPTLFVALFLMILLNYLAALKEGETPNLAIVGGLSMLGLLSKESGLIIPLVTLAYLVFLVPRGDKKKNTVIGLVLAILAAYIVFRLLAFGSRAAYYNESGYLFGSRYYENLQALSSQEKIIAIIENVIKNFLAIFLPVFDSLGKFTRLGTISNTIITLGSTGLLTILALRKKPTRFQMMALLIMLLNSAIHYQVFRYRALYLSQIAFSIFLAVSISKFDWSSLKKALALAISIIFIFWNMWVIGENLTFSFIAKQKEINRDDFVPSMMATSQRMDEGILEEVVRKYRH